jgi:hypothetical protein
MPGIFDLLGTAGGIAGAANPIGLGLSALGGIGKTIFGLFQQHKAHQIHPVYNPYEISPEAKSQLGLAQQLYNGRMFGAGDMEKNIGAGQAGYLNNINRNATDSAQALALGGLSQGVSNNAYHNLQTQESQNKYAMVNNLNNAQQNMQNEEWKKYQDMMQKYQLDMGVKTSTEQAGIQNMFGGVNDLGSMGLLMGNMFGGQQKTPQLKQVKIGAPPSWVQNYQDPGLTQIPQ